MPSFVCAMAACRRFCGQRIQSVSIEPSFAAMPFLKLFYRLILRPLRHDPLRTSLTVIAIALGVAAVLAIKLAGDAAAGSFRSSMETLTGGSALEVTGTG